MERGLDLTGPVPAGDQQAVAALLRQRALPSRWRARLERVKAAWLGADVVASARWSGRTARTVRRWPSRREALAGAPIPGRPPQADPACRAALAAAVAPPPSTLGLPFDSWTSARLSACLREQTGVHLAPGWGRVVLRQQRFAYGRPQHTLGHLHDPAEVAACGDALPAAGGKGCGWRRSGTRCTLKMRPRSRRIPT